MRTDPRSVLPGRPQAPSSHIAASRAAARRRAAGAIGALAVLFALTTTGAWAAEPPQDTSTPASTEPSPSESPSPDPTRTAEPSPSQTPTVTESPTPSPTPSEAPDDESDDSEEDDEDSEDDDPDEDETPSDDPAPSEPGDPTTDAPTAHLASAPAGFDPATGALELQPLIVAGLRFAAAEVVESDLAASFTSDPTSGTAPLTVAFTDTSQCPSWDPECPMSWEWDFGDGSDHFFGQQPDPHEYRDPGTYTVTLTVYLNYVFEGPSDSIGLAAVECTLPNCDTETLEITVEEPTPLTASFEASPESGTAPLEVDFTDTSDCPSFEPECSLLYAWDFGDPNAPDSEKTSTEQDPSHTYSQPGTYTVTLTVVMDFLEIDRVGPKVAAVEGCGENPFCDTTTLDILVTEEPDPPNASFTAIPSSGPTPLTVQFTDTSTGLIDSRSWSFNGPACGTASAGPTERQFTEVFTTVGDCVVTLQVNAPPIPDPEPSDGPQVAAFDLNCNCSITSKTITVTNKPPVIPQNDDDDPDDSDDSDDESDDSDDDPAPGVFLPNQPLTDQPSPEPTEPSPAPTSKPITPTTPTPPTDPVDPEPAAWITGPGASGAGIALMILGAVIGSLGRVGGLSMAGRQVALVADRDENTIQRHVAASDAEGWGDRSFTWRFPGHRLIDAASVVVPDRLARFSPMLGRVTEDGSEFRAMFGTLWLATPLAGIALGLASAAAAGGRALPPSMWLVAAGAVLATFDAFSGALAVTMFAGAALLGGLGGAEGGPDSVHSLLILLAIGFLWMAIPLIGSAIRPFRRLGDGSLRHRWDVIGDGLIAALLCGWVAQKLTQAMDLFAGQKTGLPEHANTIAVVVMVAVALRVAMENFSMLAYPRRLQQVEGEDPPPPFLISSILGAFIRTAIFGFIGYAFIGSCWQLWLGVGLFLIPQLIDHIREAFPNVGMVRRILPRGVVEIFILVVACTLAARFAMSEEGEGLSGIRLAFLLIAIPPALLGALRVVAEDADESGDTSWARQFLGAIIVAVTAVLASRGWDY